MLVLLEVFAVIVLVTFVVGVAAGWAASSAGEARRLRRWRAREKEKLQNRARARELQQKERRLEKLSRKPQLRDSRRQQPFIGRIQLVQTMPASATKPVRVLRQSAFAIGPVTCGRNGDRSEFGEDLSDGISFGG
jgi:hypothetical protein